jgi:hypothetical protein
MDSSDDFESETDDSEADEELVPTDNEAIQRQVRPPLLEFTAVWMLLNKTALNGIQVKKLGHIHLPVSLQVKKQMNMKPFNYSSVAIILI